MGDVVKRRKLLIKLLARGIIPRYPPFLSEHELSFMTLRRNSFVPWFDRHSRVLGYESGKVRVPSCTSASLSKALDVHRPGLSVH